MSSDISANWTAKHPSSEASQGYRGDIFSTAIKTTRMSMCVSDPRQPDNPIIFANNAFLAMTGYAIEEIAGRNCRLLQGPDTDPLVVDEIRKAIADRREFATEVLNYRKDGYSFWNALFISPIFDEAGNLVYFFASQLDVSRRREAEDALRHAQKMEALGRLTGGVAHDFNNLLQVVSGYLELIGAGLRKPEINRDKLLRGIDNATAATDRAAKLTQQLLSFARKQRLQGRVLNLNSLIASVKALVERAVGSDVKIEARTADGLWNCRIDPTQIEVALLNIMINARDAMAGQSDKRISIETGNVTVEREHGGTLGTSGPGRYVSIAIKDSGIGMPAQMVERVMDPFFTTKEEGKGTGLGLSMVYGFAKQSGGAASINSEEGRGTTVRMLFPAVDEVVEPATRMGRAIERPGTETILLVEDRTDVAEMARLILEDLGYRVLYAPNARDALAVLAKGSAIDLLFSDVIMPGDINGVELAREAMRRIPRLKVLLTTGYAEASLERDEVGGSEFDVLNKPYGRTDLARKVRVILDGLTGVS